MIGSKEGWGGWRKPPNCHEPQDFTLASTFILILWGAPKRNEKLPYTNSNNLLTATRPFDLMNNSEANKSSTPPASQARKVLSYSSASECDNEKSDDSSTKRAANSTSVVQLIDYGHVTCNMECATEIQRPWRTRQGPRPHTAESQGFQDGLNWSGLPPNIAQTCARVLHVVQAAANTFQITPRPSHTNKFQSHVTHVAGECE